ncbi:MAG TPA: zinc ABC transporter substrate-binding protein [Phycisphaerae bacterium]|nr:zinc ABC transporter substrate-binding protein [Phycisphaerae bacterium]HRY67144.1 zinc ABC transporter substrate-binding protein [Phycisphaerae bacterium]HSA26487.1 zinc ABC transporter substrate-binding protein [Phycisphaerae bacterium]
MIRCSVRRKTAVMGVTLGTVLAVAVTGCTRSSNAGKRPETLATPEVAASNSYIESAVLDLLGTTTPVLRLAEPGMCPGHFDIRPSQVNKLRACRLLLRFDFQDSLDSKLAGLTDRGLTIRAIRVTGGLCEPSSYQAVCRQVAEALVTAGLIEKKDADSRLEKSITRLHEMAAWCRQQIAEASLAGKSVVCSVHQEAFCRWLGLEIPATFTGADSASVGEIQETIRQTQGANVELVVANLPEGRRLADALGQRLGVGVIVFGNFPVPTDGRLSFDDLLTANVTQLVKAARH